MAAGGRALRERGTPVKECSRCGHDVHFEPTRAEKVRRAAGLKPRRETCGAATDLGPCPCRSRDHVS